MKRFVTIICLLLASVGVNAGVLPDAIGLHLFTVHAQKGLNDDNPGIYARWNNGLTVGTLRNSLSRRSNYVAWTIADPSDHFELTMGGITGYLKPISPLLVPSLRLSVTDHASVRLSYLKASGTPAALHLSTEWRF